MGNLQALQVPDNTASKDGFDICYEEFKRTFMSKGSRPLLGDRKIEIPLKEHNWIENKAEFFWHASSMDQKINFEILPCNNDVAKLICDENCTKCHDEVIMSNGEVRFKCLYRSERTNLLTDIISLYNEADPRVKYWEKEYKKSGRKYMRCFLRYQGGSIDYLLVFEKKSEQRVIAVTAFPVF